MKFNNSDDNIFFKNIMKLALGFKSRIIKYYCLLCAKLYCRVVISSHKLIITGEFPYNKMQGNKQMLVISEFVVLRNKIQYKHQKEMVKLNVFNHITLFWMS